MTNQTLYPSPSLYPLPTLYPAFIFSDGSVFIQLSTGVLYDITLSYVKYSEFDIELRINGGGSL
jgi:hypothetical protein